MTDNRATIYLLLNYLGLNPNLIYDESRAVDLIKTEATLRKDEEALEILCFAGYIY